MTWALDQLSEDYWRLDNVDIMAVAAREIEHEATQIEMYLEDDVPLAALDPGYFTNDVVDLDASDDEHCGQSIKVLKQMIQEKTSNAKVPPTQPIPAQPVAQKASEHTIPLVLNTHDRGYR